MALPPLAVAAQTPLPIVGFLFIGSRERSVYWTDAWHKAMSESGFVEGRDFAVEYRWGDGDATKLPGFAADLVRRRVAVIVATTEQAAMAAKQVTTSIPIVFNHIADPVGKGIVKSIARPGGNITGVTRLDEKYQGALESKRLQLLRQIIPTVPQIGYLVAEQDVAFKRRTIDAVVAAGKTLGVEVVVLTAGKVEDIDSVFGAAKRRSVGALLIQSPSTFLYAQQKHILDAGARHSMPLASGNAGFALGGGLMQYGTEQAEIPILTANYVVRILKGQEPAELPVQQPTRFRLALNLGRAKALDLAVPLDLISSADEVIE